MKRRLKNCTIARHLPILALVAGFVLPLPSQAAPVALATAPLSTSTTSTVKPNVMFILDDSGSMDWDYLPDWANDSHPVTGTNYPSMAELFRNNGFNGVAYNPAIRYTPPVHYKADGTLDTTTYPSQTGQTTATGADSAAKPNWKAVKNDAYGVQSTNKSNLVGNASHYVFVPGEYCSSASMTSCVPATAPTTVSGVLYDKPAGVRWCNSAALTTCRSINNSTYKYPRYPGLATAATATITVTGGGTATSIKVNGFEILRGATSSSGTTGTVATRIRDNINGCTGGIVAPCTIAGYSASRSGSTVTITAPTALGAITYVSVATGTMNKTITAFSGGGTLPGSNLLTNIVSTTPSYPNPGQTTKATGRSDCTADTTDPKTCTYDEEMTNYANWWTYYHTRMQAMKTSVSRAFKTIDNRFRVGFTTISYTGAVNGARFLGNDTFALAHKNSWFTKLFATAPLGFTPLRGALSKAGRYYGNKITGQVDPVQYSCQQNFTILSTDGYWNTDDETSSYKALNLTGGAVGNMDGATTARPMKEGSTAVSDTLADIAKYYYDTDLRTSTLGNCAGGTSITDFPAGNPDVCTNNVFVSSTDNNLKQHMTSFTMGLGIDGTLNFTSDYQTATSGDYYDLKNGLGSPTVNWPNPIANSAGERIDDLWHAAVNGQGIYFSAKDPDQIITGFNKALSSITAKLGSAAAAATSTLNPVAGNNFAYVASYTTVTWKGNLEARSINTVTGVVSETASWCAENVVAASCASPGTVVANTSGASTIYNCEVAVPDETSCTAPGVFVAGTPTSLCKTEIPNACTGAMAAKVGATTDTRAIYTANSAGNALIAFDAAYAAANPTNFDAAHINGLNQWGGLDPTQRIAAEGVNLINFLRGQNGFEDRASNVYKLYRARETVLGDALESQPAFIGKPVFSYPYPGYSDYKTAQALRAGTVYMGTNDGMMHAFAASDGTERWAYVPSMVIPNMWKLASTSYSGAHANFVNGSPITSDVCTANCGNSATAVWKTILVAGLNGGGRGYYALDITVPATPVLLWEFTPTTGIGAVKNDDIGYGFGQPVITSKVDGTWVVMVTSGYNNTSPGDGKGYLFVLNAGTGAIISKIATGVGDTTTPSGLARIAGWNNEPVGNKVGFAYGGDLLGNVWRFDINSTVTAAIGTGEVFKFATLFSDTAGTSPQPITTTPVLGKIVEKRVVFIGTGKYLETGDLITTQKQTQYAIKDDDATSTLVNPRTTLVQQFLIDDPAGTGTRTSSGSASSSAPSNAVDFLTGRGWFVDFPDGGTGGVGAERANIDGKLVEGTLLVPTIVPSSTVCSPGGFGWLNFFDYKTGGAVNPGNTGTGLASVKYDSTIVGVNLIYIGGEPKVEVVTSTNPTPELDPKVAFKGAAAGFTGKRVIWRELMQ